MNEIIILVSIYYFISVILFSIISYKKTSKIKNNMLSSTHTLNNIFNNDLNERLI